MKVRELVEALRALDPESEVVSASHCCGYGWLTDHHIEVVEMYSYDENFNTGGVGEFRQPHLLVDPEFDLDLDDHPGAEQFKAVVIN